MSPDDLFADAASALRAAVESRRPLVEIGDALASWFSEMHDEMAGAVIQQFGEQAAVTVSIELPEYAGVRSVRYPDDWPRALEALAAGRATKLWFYVRRPSPSDPRPPDAFPPPDSDGFAISVDSEVSPQVDLRRASFQCFPPALARDGAVPPVSQWVEHAQAAARAVRAVHGYVTISDGDDTAYERSIRRGYFHAMSELERYLRGPLWGCFLSAGHIAALGGVEAIRARAPVARVDDLSDGDHLLLYLQLTDDIFRPEAEKEAELARYLEPVLPKQELWPKPQANA